MTCVFSCFLNLPSGYIANNIKGEVNVVIIFLTATSMIAVKPIYDNIGALLIGLKWSCRVQVIWILIQYLCWSSLNLDINQAVFVDTLGMVENASQYKGTGYIPTGLSWNAGGIAPIIFIGFFLENILVWKILIVLGALLTQSATLTIGVALCIVYSVVTVMVRHDWKTLKKHSLGAIIAFIILCLSILFISYINRNLIQTEADRLMDSFSYRLNGLSSEGDVVDSSTSAHLGYIVNLPTVFAHGDIIRFLFGYGINTSGYAYSAVTGQYADQIWIVESDITNILLNVGLVGFLVFYFWLIRNVAHLFVEKSQLAPAMLVIILMGVTYNLQYPWMIFIELIIFQYYDIIYKRAMSDQIYQ